MSEENQYSDQWDDLPLPDSETAWQKMELLLDKEEKRRLVPVWFWRYAGLSLLLVGLVIGGWLLLQSGKDNNQKTISSQAKTTTQDNKQNETPITPETRGRNKKIIDERTESNRQETSTLPTTEAIVVNSNSLTTRTEDNTSSLLKSATKQRRISKRSDHLKGSPQSVAKSQAFQQKPGEINPEKNSVSAKESKTISRLPASSEEKIPGAEKKESIVKKDTMAKPEEQNPVKEAKQDSAKKKASLIVRAGVGFQQAIAINGQQTVSVNYKGKKGTLSDRIPSIYVQVQKGKWFAQAEFQYASPQPVQPFSFSQQTKYDASTVSLNTERFTIEKLYYHQLPLTVNYYLLNNWSVGGGAMYNILAGAVTEQEVQTKNLQTGTTSFQRNLAPVQGYKDSFLYKTTAGILVQTDYHWKRFSIGLRYTQNFQPFMKYTRPDGQVLDEKNKVLQAILRIRLWANQ